jgi:hypothetical protein
MSAKGVSKQRPTSEFPQLIVTVPDSWKSVVLAPLYDVHLGNANHDAALFKKHLEWIRTTPNVLTWNGGDMVENCSTIGVFDQDLQPDAQLLLAKQLLQPIAHKMLFALPGNHENRTFKAGGHKITRWLADSLDVPFFDDYCFCTIKWRGMKFQILAHHGTGAAQSPGGQRNAGRKDLAWATCFDIVWTGHLHNALVDPVQRIVFDQKTGEAVERSVLVMISPAYLKYFGSYAATARMPLGTRGLISAELQPDGSIHSKIHAKGRRL